MRAVHRLMVIGVFAAYFFSVALLQLVSGTEGAEWVLPALALFMIVRLGPLFLYQPGFGWFHPLVFGTVITFVHLARTFPAYAFGIGHHMALPEYSPADLSYLLAFELALTSVGLLAYYAGFLWGPTPRVPALRFGTPRNIGIKVAVIVLLSAALFALWLEQHGGLFTHVLSWGQSRHVSLAGEFYWLTLPTAAMFACLLWLAHDPGVLRSPLFWILGTISLGLAFLTAGSRSSVVVAAGTGLLVWMLRKRRLSVLRTVVLFCGALVLLTVLGEFRQSTWRGELAWDVFTGEQVQERVRGFVTGELHSRATSFRGVLPILARVPEEVSHLYGSSYVAVVTLPVPRKLWEDKPGLVGGRVSTTFFNMPNNGIPAGPVGEAYWNFNVPGVLVVFFLLGIFECWFARTYVFYAGAPAMVLLYIMTLVRVQPSTEAIVGYMLWVIPTLVLAFAFGMIKLGRTSLTYERVPSRPSPPS